MEIFQRDPLTGALNAGGVWTIAIFDHCLDSSRVVNCATVTCYKHMPPDRGKSVTLIAGSSDGVCWRGSGMTCQWIRQVAAPCMWHVALRSWHWIRHVAAPCNMAGGSGMACHWIRPNVRHIGILLLVSISPQSTCHSAPVCEILSKSDHPRQKKITSCRFSRWRISAILDFRSPIMGSLKCPCTTSYRSSIETMALECLVFEKIEFLYFGDRQIDRRTDGQARCMKPLSLSRAAA